ncbi:hypothetical protein IR009_15915 [Pseudomonas putida]|uniref:hypothetical protein n=1 Tax=Pseudomonas putida TaxID=303 RepID=UPI0018A987EB|nr:hypothetical protein [Pseudomonas putida]MBF8766707.1 hypothetical protein [Pseudomonas putida]
MMVIENGIYRLIGGDGWTFCAEVQEGRVQPMDPGGEVFGVIHVDDRRFHVNRWDTPLYIRDGKLVKGEEVYNFKFMPNFKSLTDPN